MLTETELRQEAAATGFRAESLEKALRLVELLEGLRRHPFLRPRLALKGGTALNLFFFDLPRLSVDVDLNYVGSADREAMLAERPRLEEAIQAVCSRLSMQVKRIPTDHAGGKWRVSYTTVFGRPGTLAIDVNFLLRVPLWEVQLADSISVASTQARRIPILDLHELAAGKLVALFARSASRDAFDSRELLAREDLDDTRLRLAFVVYGAANRRDWRTIDPEDLHADPIEFQRSLVPMLRAGSAPKSDEIEAWCQSLIEDCRRALSVVFPLSEDERNFLDAINDRGEIQPQLITGEAALQERISQHPGLLWKAQNVRRHKA